MHQTKAVSNIDRVDIEKANGADILNYSRANAKEENGAHVDKVDVKEANRVDVYKANI